MGLTPIPMMDRTKKQELPQSQVSYILGDPGADSGDEEKSKRVEKYMARRKVKNGEKSHWGQCLSGTYQKPERQRPFGTGLVRHCPQGFFSPFFTFLRAIYFSACLDFSSFPLSAPGSPKMGELLSSKITDTSSSCSLSSSSSLPLSPLLSLSSSLLLSAAAAEAATGRH